MSTHLLNEKGIDDSTENLSGITDGHQSVVIGAEEKNRKVKSKAEDF